MALNRPPEPPRLREGETDPSVAAQRDGQRAFWHMNFGHLVTVMTVIGALLIQWGRFDTNMSNQQQQTTAIKTAQNADEGKISELSGITTSLSTRVGAIEGQDIPTRLSRQDSNIASITQQVQDLVAAVNRGRDDRMSWQNDISAKLDKLIEKVAHIEGKQDKGR